MRATLIQPPVLVETKSDLTPPLGLLMIAAILEQEGLEVTLIDMNLKGMQDPSWLDKDSFYQNAHQQIMTTKPDIVGFTSMGLESHVCLDMARNLKLSNPDITTLFGGPHFGSIAKELLENYSWVDYVVVGEGELPTKQLVRFIRDKCKVENLVNVAYRKNKTVQLQRKFKWNIPLDELPLPAYHLVDLEDYYEVNPFKMVCFEHARGCMLKCSFCYSPVHWGHGEQSKSISNIIGELKLLKKMGAKQFFFVADNFINIKSHAIEICDAMIEAKVDIKWHCYSTLAQLTEPIIKKMSEAGCRSVFVGVDAVSENSKSAYNKTYFKGWQQLKSVIKDCKKNKIQPIFAFMLSPLDSDIDLELTLRTTLLSYSVGSYYRINVLTIYNQTNCDSDIQKAQTQYSTARPFDLMDTAEINISNHFATVNPRFFPMHCTVSDKIKDDEIILISKIATCLIQTYPRTLIRLFIDHNQSLLELFRKLGNSLEKQFGGSSDDFYLIADTFKKKRWIPKIKSIRQIHRFEKMRFTKPPKKSNRLVKIQHEKRNDIYTILPHKIISLPFCPSKLLSDQTLDRNSSPSKRYITAYRMDPSEISLLNEENEKIFCPELSGENDESSIQVESKSMIYQLMNKRLLGYR